MFPFRAASVVKFKPGKEMREAVLKLPPSAVPAVPPSKKQSDGEPEGA